MKIRSAKSRLPVALALVLSTVLSSLGSQETPEAKARLSVKVDQIVSKDYPGITAYAVVENDKGEAVTSLSPSLFKFRIDSMEYKMKTSIVPFSMKESPIDYTILVSNNGIMDGEPLDFQKNAVLQFIDMMKPSDRLSLYTIGEEAVPVFEALTKEEIDVALVNKIPVAPDQPRVYDSLIGVLRKVERRTTERKAVIVISDGRDQNSRFTKEQLNDVLSECGVPVYAIGIRVLTSQSLSNLNEIADKTGGTYLFSAALKSVPADLKNLMGKITQCYVISLKVKDLKGDNLPHHLEIAVDERDASGKGEKAFVAVRHPVPRWVKWAILGGVVLFAIAMVILSIIFGIRKRKKMGITKRRCPSCHARMKDSWDTCPFCKYLGEPAKKKKKAKKDA